MNENLIQEPVEIVQSETVTPIKADVPSGLMDKYEASATSHISERFVKGAQKLPATAPAVTVVVDETPLPATLAECHKVLEDLRKNTSIAAAVKKVRMARLQTQISLLGRPAIAPIISLADIKNIYTPTFESAPRFERFTKLCVQYPLLKQIADQLHSEI